MGTFLGHIVPGLAFALFGLWHTLNTIRSYKLKGPSNFTSATWFPFPTIKHLELYLLLSFSLLAAVLQLLDYPLFALSFKPDNLEHATMFLHVIIYASVALAVDFSSSPNTLAGLVGALAASAFGQELFLLHFHSTDHVGLEGHYHWLLQLIATASFLASVVATGAPGSFVAAVIRSASVMFQGLWFVVMGFALWVPSLAPKGCHAVASAAARQGAVACATEEASTRAVALANLQFSWTLAGVCILTAYLSLRPGMVKPVEYRQLQPRGFDMCQGSADHPGEGIKQVHVAF
ncbi:hypothetical protein Cni_G17595 [Canna indica]|uniref:Transmembrane protein 45B n=1 Tax=Canna indica TaxID=4628 RepID=A0AAQ3KJ94_9LILI|nr:hypothetical protein Cni_G17595 [Canna indica]